MGDFGNSLGVGDYKQTGSFLGCLTLVKQTGSFLGRLTLVKQTGSFLG